MVRFQLRRRRLLFAVSFTAVGQGASSFGNFLLTVLVARHAPPHDFGVFGLAFTGYVFALICGQVIASGPLTIRVVGRPAQERRSEFSGSVAAASWLGVAVSGVALALFWILEPPANGLVWTLVAVLPFLLAYDAIRHVYLVDGSAKVTAAMDVAWLLGQCGLSVACYLTGHVGPSWFLGAWAVPPVVIATALAIRRRLGPSCTRARNFVRRHRDFLPDMFAELTASAAVVQLVPVLVAASLGVAEVGYFRAALTLFGVVNILAMGLSPVMQIKFGLIRESGASALRRTHDILALCLCGIGAAWGVTLMLLPDWLGRAMLGAIWAPTAALLPPLALHGTARLVQYPTSALLTALRSRERSIRRLTSAALLLGATVVGANFGLTWMLWAMAAASWTSAALALAITRRVTKEEVHRQPRQPPVRTM